MDECTAAHEKLDFIQAGRVAYDFFWNQFADWYVEAAKTRLYSSDPARAAMTREVCTALSLCQAHSVLMHVPQTNTVSGHADECSPLGGVRAAKTSIYGKIPACADVARNAWQLCRPPAKCALAHMHAHTLTSFATDAARN